MTKKPETNIAALFDAITQVDNELDLERLSNALKHACRRLDQKRLEHIRPGQMVEFRDRYGNLQRGQVEKVNARTVILLVGTVRFHVPAGLIEVPNV